MRTPSTRAALLLLLLVAFGLRVYALDVQELRGDEAFGYFFSQRPLPEVVSATLDLQEPHPVASYFVQKGWLILAGDSEFALRATGVWFSVLAVALVYRLGRSLALPANVSALASALMAVSPYIIWHAQDARMYSMSLALTLASTWMAVEWLNAAGLRHWGWAAGYVVVSWLALHTHYFAAFVLVAHYLYVVGLSLWARQWRTVIGWLMLQGSVLLLYLPWLLRAAGTLSGYGGNGDSPPFVAMLQRSLSVFAAGESVPATARGALAVLALVLLCLGTWRLLRQGPAQRRAALLLWLYLAVPVMATWASALARPIFNERYLVAAAPPIFLLMASALFTPQHEPIARRYPPLRYTAATLLVLLMTVMALSLNRHYHDPAYSKTRGWRDLAAAIEAYSLGMPAEDVRIAQNYPDPTLWYYYRGSVAHVVLPPTPLDVAGAEATVAMLEAEGVRRVILPVQPAPNWDDASIAQDALSQHYFEIQEDRVGVWPLGIYQAQTPSLFEEIDIAHTFANGVRLTGRGRLPDTLPRGGLLTVPLSWTAATSDASESAANVTVQLLGPEGNLLAQEDRRLVDGRWDSGTDLRTAFGLAIDQSIGDGPFQLIVALYTADEEGVQRIQTEEGADAVLLWTFEQ